MADGTDCEVLKTLYEGKTTKDGLYPKGTVVEALLVNCDAKPSPVKKTVLRIHAPPNNVEQIVVPTQGPGVIVATAFASDPFEVGVFESNGSALNPFHAYRYNLDTKEFQDLGALGGPTGSSTAKGVNIDGTVVVGFSNLTTAGDSVYQAFRWTPALGMQNLGAIQPGSYSEAHATNHDGTVVVGGTYAPGLHPGDYDVYHAFRWVLSNPATGAGTFTDLGAATYEAYAVSSDGSVVVGAGYPSAGNKAFRWTQAGGVVSLGALPGHSFSLATAVSADGKVVVGISSATGIGSAGYAGAGPSFDNISSRAFRWTQATGMVDLNTLAANAGYDLTGITLLAALGLSADGQTIVGAGIRSGAEDTLGFSIHYADATNGGGAAATVPVVEYYNAVLDHYFITPVAAEIALLNAKTPPFQDWSRTGFTFNGYVNATAPAGSVAICRFFNSSFAPKSSHFYAPHGLGCEATLSTFPDWKLEDDKLFNVMLPDAGGVCPAGTLPVYRLYNNGMGGAPNHRFVTSLAERQIMIGKGYVPEGNGIGVGMCAPQ